LICGKVVGFFEVAQPLFIPSPCEGLAVRTLQNPHRQECLCY